MSKKIYLSIILAFIFSSIFSQSDTINQTDENGNKIGYWQELYSNQNIKICGNYKLIQEKISKEEAFMRGVISSADFLYDTTSVKHGKWTEYYENKIVKTITSWKNGKKIELEEFYPYEKIYLTGKDKIHKQYFYDENWNLIEIVLTDNIQNKVKYLFGANSELEITNKKFYFFDRANTNVQAEIVFKSLSDDEIILSLPSNCQNIKFKKDKVTIPPNQSFALDFTYNISLGNTTDNLTITTNIDNNISINFLINSYGYQLKGSEMNNFINKKMIIRVPGDTFYFVRDDYSSEIHFYSYDKKLTKEEIDEGKSTPVLSFPTSREINEIDIKKLPKGKYIIKTVDFNFGNIKFGIIEIE
ncbi:MAG: hypothetical protein JXL97_16195 [Bacteroidales bacterium]|nr:hypothetical protein [Bacteroidales bacterium]